jgi:hypothetical protein
MPGPYRYSDAAYAYVDARGRFLSSREVREALDGALASVTARTRALAVDLRERRISLADWQLGMMREMKAAHLYGAAAARGGWQNMTPADYGRVGQQLRQQYEYLRAFGADILSGKQRMDGTLASRAELYGQSGRVTYHEVEKREMQVRGRTEERNVRHPSDHCEGCQRETARGWVPLGSLAPVGSRDCRTRDRCTIEYR